MRRVFPKADIRRQRLHSYPIVVIVSFNGHELWRGPQRNLFMKYMDERSKAQLAIAAAVARLLDADTYARLTRSPGPLDTQTTDADTDTGDVCEPSFGKRWW